MIWMYLILGSILTTIAIVNLAQWIIGKQDEQDRQQEHNDKHYDN